MPGLPVRKGFAPGSGWVVLSLAVAGGGFRWGILVGRKPFFTGYGGEKGAVFPEMAETGFS